MAREFMRERQSDTAACTSDKGSTLPSIAIRFHSETSAVIVPLQLGNLRILMTGDALPQFNPCLDLLDIPVAQNTRSPKLRSSNQ